MRFLLDREFEIMEVLWASEGVMQTEELLRCLNIKKKRALWPVKFFLNRLVRSKMVVREGKGQNKDYAPAVSRNEYASFGARRINKRLQSRSPFNIGIQMFDKHEMEEWMEYCKRNGKA